MALAPLFLRASLSQTVWPPLLQHYTYCLLGPGKALSLALSLAWMEALGMGIGIVPPPYWKQP